MSKVDFMDMSKIEKLKANIKNCKRDKKRYEKIIRNANGWVEYLDDEIKRSKQEIKQENNNDNQ